MDEPARMDLVNDRSFIDFDLPYKKTQPKGATNFQANTLDFRSILSYTHPYWVLFQGRKLAMESALGKRKSASIDTI